MKSTFMFIDMSELSVAEEYMFLNSDFQEVLSNRQYFLDIQLFTKKNYVLYNA